VERAKAAYTERALTGCALHTAAVTRCLKREGALSLAGIYFYKNAAGEVELADACFRPGCFTDDRRLIRSFWWDGSHVRTRGAPPALYNRDLLDLSPYTPALVVADAEAADAAARLGEFIPTCLSAGTEDLRLLNAGPFAARVVYIYPEDSAAGRKRAAALEGMLRSVAERVVVVEPAPEGRRIKSHGAGIIEALEVLAPWELAEYIQNFRPLPAVPEKAAPEAAGAQAEADELLSGGEYGEIYGVYRELIRRGMADRHINAFAPTEDGEARAAARYTAGYIRFADGLGWMAFDPETGAYRRDIGEYILRYCLRLMARERWDLRESEDKEYYAYAKAAGTEPGVRHVMKHLESDPRILSRAADYDKDPHLLNCRGITVDLRTGTRRPSLPGDLHTKTALCRPAERPPSPEFYPAFAGFLMDVTRRDLSMIAWIMRFLGYSLSGDTRASFFMNLHGGGGNGKGTLLHVVRQIFGDYAMEIPEAIVVTTGRQGNIDHAHAAIRGVRLGIAADVPPGKMNTESLFHITGGDELNAELKFQNSFTYRPIAKIILSTNEQLRLPDTGQNVRRRLRYVPFEASFAGREDTGLEDRILTEAPEILAVLIGEAQAYFRAPGPRAFPPCEAIDRDTAKYIASEDVIGQFLEEKTLRAEGERVKAAELYQAYREWAMEKGERRPMSQQAFGRKMAGRAKKDNVGGNVYYFGITRKGIYD
jgi:putative DNA primase/helicase